MFFLNSVQQRGRRPLNISILCIDTLSGSHHKSVKHKQIIIMNMDRSTVEECTHLQ